MKTKKIKAASSLRFRRWSRAGYAIFCSLACTVTIGCVCVSISDKSLQKAVGVSQNTLSAFEAETESGDTSPELAELDAAIQKLQELSFFELTTDRAAACDLHSNIYLLIKTVEMSFTHPDRFLFYQV